MSWSISWSWQASERVSAIAAVEGVVVVSNGLELTLIESHGSIRWTVKTLFRIHSIFSKKNIPSSFVLIVASLTPVFF